MLAGILIVLVVVAGMAFALPWVTAQRVTDQELEGDPSERFSDSIRILSRDVSEYQDDDGASVSTPLTRRAELNELRLIARQAARRRLTVVAVLSFGVVSLTILALFGHVAWWAPTLPLVLLGAFLGIARFSVVAMHRNLDARAEAVKAGYEETEDTEIIDLSDAEATEKVEISVDLSMPTTMGALWEPIPVTPATYVSQPLMPRTVRTIDLSAPVDESQQVVPTADDPEADVADEESITEQGSVTQLRPRAVGE